jgi:hypothetical protein
LTDEKGAHLSGVIFSAVGANKNALKDNAGSFSIQVPEKVRRLRITYVGYGSKDVSINGLSSVSVNLNQEDKSLSEMVVVGFGTQKK